MPYVMGPHSSPVRVTSIVHQQGLTTRVIILPLKCISPQQILAVGSRFKKKHFLLFSHCPFFFLCNVYLSLEDTPEPHTGAGLLIGAKRARRRQQARHRLLIGGADSSIAQDSTPSYHPISLEPKPITSLAFAKKNVTFY